MELQSNINLPIPEREAQQNLDFVIGAKKNSTANKENISSCKNFKNSESVNNESSIYSSPVYFQKIDKDARQKKDSVNLEIEIIYKEDEDVYEKNKNSNEDKKPFWNKHDNLISESENKTQNSKFIKSSKYNSGLFLDQNETELDLVPHPMDLYRHSCSINFPKNRIEGTFIENELKKSGDPSKNYVKIELRVRRNKINLETMLNCFEYFINKNVEFHYDKDNIISYFYAFSVCKIEEKKKEVLDRLLLDLNEENIIYFIKVISYLNDEFLNSYCFWLIRHLVNKNEKLDEICFDRYKFKTIVKLANGLITFDKKTKNIVYSDKNFSLSANLKFLMGFYNNFRKTECEKYYKPNNYFNIGKIIRRKSDEKLIKDYPHYYQMKIENDPQLSFYAIRPGENSSFILSKNIVKIY